MIDRILTAVDKSNISEVILVILHLIDLSQAFNRQSPKLAKESIMENGVQRSLITGVINSFQDRKMHIKWKNYILKARDLPGDGPQGCPL